MGDIIYINGASADDHEDGPDPDVVLEAAKGCSEVVVLGEMNGTFYAAASGLDIQTVIYYLRRAEHILMTLQDSVEQQS